MHRTALLLASTTVLALAGCASGGTPSRSSAPNRVVSTSNGMDVYLNPEDESTTDMVQAAPPEVWTALVAAYSDLGVEVGTADPANRVLGNHQLMALRRLGDEPLTTYFDCGSAGLSGKVAAQARLTIDLYTQLQPEGSGTLVVTHATAKARPINGTGAAYAGCRSSGELEKRIAALVRKHLEG
jgi:hypothetical protein